MDQTRL